MKPTIDCPILYFTSFNRQSFGLSHVIRQQNLTRPVTKVPIPLLLASLPKIVKRHLQVSFLQPVFADFSMLEIARVTIKRL